MCQPTENYITNHFANRHSNIQSTILVRRYQSYRTYSKFNTCDIAKTCIPHKHIFHKNDLFLNWFYSSVLRWLAWHQSICYLLLEVHELRWTIWWYQFHCVYPSSQYQFINKFDVFLNMFTEIVTLLFWIFHEYAWYIYHSVYLFA